MEAVRTPEPDDNYTTEDGKIRITPEEWATGYAYILASPCSWNNKTIAPVLAQVLLRTEGITRLQMAEALGILLDRVERTRKKIDQILPGLVTQTGKGQSARMSLNPARFGELKLDQKDEKSAREQARSCARNRVNTLHLFKVRALSQTLKTKFNLTGYELNLLGCILNYGHKGYKPYITQGMDNFTLAALRSLTAKLPPDTIYEDRGTYFACDEILNVLGEQVFDYTAREERIENPDGPYPLEILYSVLTEGELQKNRRASDSLPEPAPEPPAKITQGMRVYPAARPRCARADLPPDADSWSLARLHKECPWYITVYPHIGPEGGAPDELIARIMKERKQGEPPAKKPKRKHRKSTSFATLQSALDALEDSADDFEEYLAGQEKDL